MLDYLKCMFFGSGVSSIRREVEVIKGVRGDIGWDRGEDRSPLMSRGQIGGYRSNQV